jgi:hypothetical protein
MLAFSPSRSRVSLSFPDSMRLSHHVNRVNYRVFSLRHSRVTENGKTTERW